MKQCIQCGLPESYHGISFDEKGVCNFCGFFEEHRERLMDFDKLEEEFTAITEQAKKEAYARGAKYDCLVGISGGKDSTYIVYQLVHRYGMRVLTFTLDNGFSTDFGKRNIDNAVTKLDVDHIHISPKESELRSLYTKSVKILHNFCGVCFHLMHYYSFQTAAQYQIPLIVNGRTRGQILQSAADIRGIEPFEQTRGLKDFEYQMFGPLVDKLDERGRVDYLPGANAQEVSYFAYHDVTEEETMQFLERAIGWERPKEKGKHPDCWAHAMAEKMNLEKHGYPIRTGELAVQVRCGELTKEEAEAILQEDREEFSGIPKATEDYFYDRIRVNKSL